MINMNPLTMNPLDMLLGAFFAPVIHEWIRALTSTALGDPTPRNNGFMTFNPFKFFEPVGFILTLIFRFGWGRPVPTSPVYYKNRNQGILLTNILPSVANLSIGILAIFIANSINIPLHLWGDANGYLTLARRIFWTTFHFGSINIGLALFNLIPVYPLDMQKIMMHFSSPDMIQRLNHYEKPMQIILILLLVFGIIGRVIDPIRSVFVTLIWY